MILTITILLLIFGAIAKVIMDLSSEDRFSQKWMNKNQSWERKWKNGDPEQGEKFTFSSTLLVWITDLWHFSQMIFLSCWQMALAINLEHTLIAYLVIKIIFSGVFEIIYRTLKKNLK